MPNLSIHLSEDVFILEERTSTGIYTFAAIILSFIGFFGFVLNLLVIVTVIKNANVLWTPINVILVNMVVGDFLVAALGNPFAITSAVAGVWFWSYDVCLWYAWFMTTMGFASIGNLTVMAIERFLLVTCPMKTISIRHAYILAILVWMYSFSLSLPPFFNWGTYGPEAGTKNRREKKVTKMVYLMILAFLIAWSPYAVLALATQYFYIQTSHLVAVLPTLLAKSSICYNPIIYASMTVHFPNTWKKMFSINGYNATARNKQQHGCELQFKREVC
ncbi:melanopsin isoform X2 [Solenopsis invicta]|uniref:melanopsin isoform X2 n=1 Tax=Solenopsis invicta TaxID=13686 RepID=UPI00193DA030|nr:melanopsin isoform X2 [Solenopsis invicta]